MYTLCCVLSCCLLMRAFRNPEGCRNIFALWLAYCLDFSFQYFSLSKVAGAPLVYLNSAQSLTTGPLPVWWVVIQQIRKDLLTFFPLCSHTQHICSCSIVRVCVSRYKLKQHLIQVWYAFTFCWKLNFQPCRPNIAEDYIHMLLHGCVFVPQVAKFWRGSMENDQ